MPSSQVTTPTNPNHRVQDPLSRTPGSSKEGPGSATRRSGGSNHSSGRKSFFNKILRRRSDSIPESIASSSTKLSDNVSMSPLSKHSTSTHKSGGGFVSRKGSSKSKSRPNSARYSSNSFGSVVLDDNSSVYDYHDGDTREGTIRSDSLSSRTSSISDSSLGDALNFSSSLENHARDEQLDFPTIGDRDPTFVGEADNVFNGLSYDALNTPKYTRAARKNKHAPRILNNLFLAQELNTEHLGSDHEIDSSDDSDNDFASRPHKVSKKSSSNSDSTTAESEQHRKDNSNDPIKSTHGEIFVMEFSRDGKYLAAAGRDSKVKVWKVISSPLSRLESKNAGIDGSQAPKSSNARDKVFNSANVFSQEPIRIFEGHTHSILSLDWSKNNFLVTGSMDRTAKLWHVDRPHCLQTFQHDDFVTGVKFHPTDDRFFLSGSLDNEVRLWSVLEKSVAFSKNVGNDVLVTALCFTPDGSHCLVGGFNGTITLLETKGLYFIYKYEVKERSLVHPFNNRNGNKITGIQVFENEAASRISLRNDLFEKWNILITTNDSKIRLINSSSKKLVTRFKGLSNNSSSIVATMSDDHHYIISGSEDHWCYVWENNNYIINNKLRSALKDLVLEGKHHISDLNKKHKKYSKLIQDNKLLKKLNIQHFLEDEGSAYEYVSNENNSYTTFHAHHSKVNAAIFAPENTKRLLEFSDDIIYDLVRRGRKYGIEPKEDNHHEPQNHELSRSKTVEDLNRGHIIVSADQYGVIRVFRQDSAHDIRKRLIDLKKHSKGVPTKAGCKHNTLTSEDSRLGASRGSNLKLDLSNINKKIQLHGRSLSPTSEVQASFKDKLHSKFKPNSSGPRSSRSRNNTVSGYEESRSPSYSPVVSRTQPENLQSSPGFPRIVSSGSLINVRQAHSQSTTGGMFDNSGFNIHVASDSDDAGSRSEENSQFHQNSFTPNNQNTDRDSLTAPTTATSTTPQKAAEAGHGDSVVEPTSPSFQRSPGTRNMSSKIPLIINTEVPRGSDPSRPSEIINFQTPVDKKSRDSLGQSIQDTHFDHVRGRKR